jgi:very-short-patch-repair endonuclease
MTTRPIPDALASGPFRLSTAEHAGVTRSQLRGRSFSRPFRGVHVVGAASALRELCEAALVLLPHAVFSDETAAALLGLPTWSRGVVHVTTPRDRPAVRRRGIVGHVRDLTSHEVGNVDGLPVTSAARTYVDLAGELVRPQLLAVGDALVRAKLATVVELTATVAEHAGRRGICAARALLDLIDGRSESVMESVLRLLLIDAGLPVPEVNAEVFDRYGRFLARADLLYRAARVIVEYDGDQHRTDRNQFAHDVRRGSRLAADGYVVLRFTASDVFQRPSYVVATVRQALGLAR